MKDFNVTVIAIGDAGVQLVKDLNVLPNVKVILCNTEYYSLQQNKFQTMQLGSNITRGLGAGGDPVVGKEAAEESLDHIMKALHEVNMLLIIAGMGRGTGSGATPIIAQTAQSMGIATVSIVTQPFSFEGDDIARIAEASTYLLEQVGATVIIPNEKLVDVKGIDKMNKEIFLMANQAVVGVIEVFINLLIQRDIMNLHLSDIASMIKTAMTGRVILGIGEAAGDKRAIRAAVMALNNLLSDSNLSSAKTLLLHIAGSDVTIREMREVIDYIKNLVPPVMQIKTGVSIIDTNAIRVFLLAGGFSAVEFSMPELSKEGLSLYEEEGEYLSSKSLSSLLKRLKQ